MNRLPTGMYLPGDSFFHRLDSRVKLLILFITIVAILFIHSPFGYLVMSFFIAFNIFLAGITLSTAMSSISNLRWFFVVIFLMNTAFYSPQDAWISYWIFTPSTSGMRQGLDVVLRVCLVLVISNVITSTTAPMEITNALEKIFSPLKFIGIPTEQIAMILSIAIQFIPTLSEETETIRKAQMARGARFDSPKLIEKAKAVLPLVIPIFFAAFKRADELATAMEARGYRGATGRTIKKSNPLQLQDYGALVITILIGILLFILR